MESLKTDTKDLSRVDLLNILSLFLTRFGNEGHEVLQGYINNKKSATGRGGADSSSKQPTDRNIEGKEEAKKQKDVKVFDMNKYRQRHIALHLQYDGGSYFGFASQTEKNCEETVEKYLFESLIKLRLISSRKVFIFNFCF